MKNKLNLITGTQGFKAAVLIILTLIMLIPISMVRSLITERSDRAGEVKNEISAAAGGPLLFGGPILKIPGIRKIEKVYTDNEGRKSSESYEEEFSLWYAAKELDIDISLDSRNKFRGIFYSPIFSGKITLSGNFNTGGITEDLESNERLMPENSELIIPFFNQKGIRRIGNASLMEEQISFLPGSRGLAFSSGGIYSTVPFNMAQLRDDTDKSFDFTILVGGADRINLLPIAASTHAELRADWKAPSFGGRSLPDSSEITDSGFSAVWNCSSLSSGIPVKWDDSTVFDSYMIDSSYIETEFINVHDHYDQNERAVKYAVLFILLPFITLFIFESFFRLRLHIIQYILAAVANIIFYLLLLSLSEHISFNMSYLISAAAVTVLICFYTFSILKHEKRAWLMAPVMIGVYTFLFMTLQSEDWALLIGSIGVFIITAFLMFITRKIDFYQSQQNQK